MSNSDNKERPNKSEQKPRERPVDERTRRELGRIANKNAAR